MHWPSFIQGMVDARSTGEPGAQATTEEAALCGGPDFLSEAALNSNQWAWHCGYDHAVLLARGQ